MVVGLVYTIQNLFLLYEYIIYVLSYLTLRPKLYHIRSMQTYVYGISYYCMYYVVVKFVNHFFIQFFFKISGKIIKYLLLMLYLIQIFYYSQKYHIRHTFSDIYIPTPRGTHNTGTL